MKILFSAVLLLFACFAPLHVLAFESKGTATSFEEAAKAKNFLRFSINTKKLGLFKSQVTGYAKKFSAEAKLEGLSLASARITFPIRELDTDLYARNDQMWNSCLGLKDHPEMEVRLPSLSFTEGKAVTANATILVRGKEKPLPVELTFSKTNGHWLVKGNAHTTFEALEIPDPSIGVASVDGPIDIEFSLEESQP